MVVVESNSGSVWVSFRAMGTIFVITANRFFRESLVRLFRSDRGFRVSGAPDCTLLLSGPANRVNPDVVVLRPEWDREFQSTRAIHEAAPETKILMIGMEDDEEMFLLAVQAGAEGYLLRDASAKQMLAAAHKLHRNSVVCPQHLERALFNLIASGPRLKPGAAQMTCVLTPREHQLSSLVAQGLANKEIAGRLNLSIQTVKNHVHSILQKTQSKNRAMLAQILESRPLVAEPAAKLTPRVSIPL
jgi:DNA-binding NarL/FixJ family response regulator